MFIVELLSVIVAFALLFVAGWSVLNLFDSSYSEGPIDRAILSVTIGLTLLAAISYLFILFGLFSGLASLVSLALVCVLAVLASKAKWSKEEVIATFKLTASSIKRHLRLPRTRKDLRNFAIGAIPVIFLLLIAFWLRIDAVLRQNALLEIDPWYWLYNSRFLISHGAPDYAQASAYPLGLSIVLSVLATLDSSYEFLLLLFRFTGPILATFTALVVYRLAKRYTNGAIAPAVIAGLAFAFSHNLRFSGRLTIPETFGVLFFIVTLGYMYIYKHPRAPVISILFAGSFIFHPLGCAVLLGVVILVELFNASRENVRSALVVAARELLMAIIILAPMLVAIGLNSTLFSSYAYYTTPSDSNTPLSMVVVVEWLDYFSRRSLGYILFAVASLAGAIALVYKTEDKWLGLTLVFFLLWIAFSWFPIHLTSIDVKRAASWAVFPLSLLVCKSYMYARNKILGHSLRASESIANNSHFSVRRDMKKSMLLGLMFSLIIVSQTLSAMSYTYNGTYYISKPDEMVMEWVALNLNEAQAVYVYKPYYDRSIAAAILFPMQPFANDTIRNSDFATIDRFVSNWNVTTAVILRESENLYNYALAHSWKEVFNVSVAESLGWYDTFQGTGIHVYLVSVNVG